MALPPKIIGLREAFDAAGMKLYGVGWTGDEADYDPGLSASRVKTKRIKKAWSPRPRKNAPRALDRKGIEAMQGRFIGAGRATIEILRSEDVTSELLTKDGTRKRIDEASWPEPDKWDGRSYTQHIRWSFATGFAKLNILGRVGEQTSSPTRISKDPHLWHIEGGIAGEVIIGRAAFQDALEELVAPDPNRTGARTRERRAVAKHPGGRPPKYDRNAFTQELLRVANTPDGLPERRLLFGLMADWCSETWDNIPAESTIRGWISAVYPPNKN